MRHEEKNRGGARSAERGEREGQDWQGFELARGVTARRTDGRGQRKLIFNTRAALAGGLSFTSLRSSTSPVALFFGGGAWFGGYLCIGGFFCCFFPPSFPTFLIYAFETHHSPKERRRTKKEGGVMWCDVCARV